MRSNKTLGNWNTKYYLPPKTAKYRVGEHLDLHGLPKISRADVADFSLNQLEDATYLRKSVLISY